MASGQKREFGDWVTWGRKQLHISRLKLALAAGVEPNDLLLLEKGMPRNLLSETAARLESYLNKHFHDRGAVPTEHKGGKTPGVQRYIGELESAAYTSACWRCRKRVPIHADGECPHCGAREDAD